MLALVDSRSDDSAFAVVKYTLRRFLVLRINTIAAKHGLVFREEKGKIVIYQPKASCLIRRLEAGAERNCRL